MKPMVWDVFECNEVEMPAEMQAFLTEIEAVSRKYGLSLAHEDAQGGFIVEVLKESNLRWLAGAAKRYTRELVPETGMALSPALMGQNCPAMGPICRRCRYKDYCFNPYNRRAAERLEEVLEGAKA